MKSSALLTDYYQLSMAYGYWQLGMHNEQAVFHLFFRRNPVQGDYVIASGLQPLIDFIQSFHFSDTDIAYLRSLKNANFSDDFLAYLKTVRFTGDIDAVPEGSVVFANEPLLRITAPLLIAQILETSMINFINFSSAVSTLASRMRTIVGDFATLFEFGMRRAQGCNGALTASRAAYLGGFDATSNLMAGQQFNIPVVGTMSHSWVMAFDSELAAFEAYSSTASSIILLVDTYDTLTGIDHVIALGNQLKQQGKKLSGVRLDSGELGTLSRIIREKLNHAGFHDTKIYVSGDLSEERLIDLMYLHAPIDGFGVGTQLATAYEQPALDMVYKLSAIEKNGRWIYKAKRSDNRAKTSDPGMLQVKRFYQNKKWLRDVIYDVDAGMTETAVGDAQSCDLLLPVFRKGKLVVMQASLQETQSYCREQVKQFHASKGLHYTVQKDNYLIGLKKHILEE